MKDEKKGMPSVIHEIEILGPSENLKELKMEVNDKLEELAKAFINGVQLYETTQGWVFLVWYKII
jgi:hypothetical protein